MSKKKILVVDNDPYILLVTKSRLEANGYEVFTTLDGTETVKIAKKVKPDLILLDIIMPAMEGCDVCSKLKQEMETKEIPVLMFTVSSRKDIEELCAKAGAKAAIAKPFDPAELLALIKKAMDPNSKWRRPRRGNG